MLSIIDWIGKAMAEFRKGKVQCRSVAGFHDMAYVEWGDPSNPKVLICVHGLTRCGRDFDDLARAMCDEYRVVCPDMSGHGLSDRLQASHLYSIPQYCRDMATLLASLNAETVHWVGTSMGGVIGMVLAGLGSSDSMRVPHLHDIPHSSTSVMNFLWMLKRSVFSYACILLGRLIGMGVGLSSIPISRLVLNDVGPVIATQSLARIGEELGKEPRFESYAEAEAFLRMISSSFGTLTDAQWRQLTVHIVHEAPDGKFEFIYDPAIILPFKEAVVASGGKDIKLWPIYDAIKCPTFLLRGEQSDLLSSETAKLMTLRGPKAQLLEIPDVGHAPALMDTAQIAPIRNFLLPT